MIATRLKSLSRETFDTDALVREFPPRWQDDNKLLVHAIACPPGSTHRGQIRVSRWRALALPDSLPGERITQFEAHADLFGYQPTPADRREVEWYLNFAHHDLFVAYGGSLLAQDELQVAEHPALGSVREALVSSSDFLPYTVQNGEPTPILLTGVERRCAIATDRNAAEERPRGLYGNHFRAASESAIRRATRRLDPPTITNLIAMEAPVGYSGAYAAPQIRYILTTATTGFAAAVRDTNVTDPDHATVVHTGFWGCGAYGGNRELMALLQLVSADLARVDRLVFHTFDDAGMATYRAALDVAETLLDKTSLDDMLAEILARGYQWGVGDGT